MLKIEVLGKDDVSAETLRIQLSGVMDAGDRLPELRESYPSLKKLEIDCGRIHRMNSQGVREWIRAFSRLRALKVKLEFHNVPVFMVELMNQIRNLIAPDEVASIMAPYFCGDCRSEKDLWIARASFATVAQAPAQFGCVSCGGRHRFDSDPIAYFAFALRS